MLYGVNISGGELGIVLRIAEIFYKRYASVSDTNFHTPDIRYEETTATHNA
jgi:hypothetical protein